MDLIKDMIKVDSRVDFGRFQTFLESEVLVPDVKEDVFEIVKTEGYITLKKEEVLDGKVILRGDLNYNVIYLTQDKKVSNLYGKLELNDVMEKENIRSSMKPILRGEIEHIDCNIINERKIKLGGLINIKGSLFGREKVDILREISGLEDVQSYKEEIEYEDIIGIESAESVIRESISLGGDMENIENILSLSPKVKLRETRLSDNKVILGGVISVNPIALSKEGDLIKGREEQIEFTQFVEVPGASEGMRENSFVELLEFNFNLKQEEEETGVLEIDATIKSKVRVSENIIREILQDAYCPYRNLKLEDKYLHLNKTLSHGVEDFSIKETIQNDREDIQIKEILNVEPKLFITDNFIMEDKNVLEGIIHVDISYIPVEGLRPVYTITEEIPFKHGIDMMKTKENVISYGHIEVEGINYSLQKEEIEVEIKGKAHFEIVEEIKNKFIVNGELQGNVDSNERPSITIYIAQEGDTLWDVAKRYNTTLEEIAQTNEMEGEDILTEGQCLIIEKKITTEI